MRSIYLAAALALASTTSHACIASFYGAESGRWNADGSRFRPGALSMAHPTAPLHSRFRVRRGGRSLVLTVKDRGPARWTGRCADLSRGAAVALGFVRRGLADIRLERLR